MLKVTKIMPKNNGKSNKNDAKNYVKTDDTIAKTDVRYKSQTTKTLLKGTPIMIKRFAEKEILMKIMFRIVITATVQKVMIKSTIRTLKVMLKLQY